MISARPNTAIINLYRVGDFIPPHIDHTDYPRPFSTLSLLSEAPMLFGVSMRSKGNGVFTAPYSVVSVSFHGHACTCRPFESASTSLSHCVLLCFAVFCCLFLFLLCFAVSFFFLFFLQVLPRCSLLVLEGNGANVAKHCKCGEVRYCCVLLF